MKQNQECGAGNQKERVTGKFLRCVLVGLTILTLCLIAQSAKALPIKEIGIPMLGTKYNYEDHVFSISGLSDVTVFYEDSKTDYSANFTLTTKGSTKGLLWNMTSDGKHVTYSSSNSGTGRMSLVHDDGSNYGLGTLLLGGELQHLEMTIVDSTSGLYKGTGMFSVVAGTLASDFGENGGLATIGIAFKVPINFNNSFTAMANTKIYPIASIPDVTTLVLLGSAMLIGSLFGRKKAF